MTGFKTEKQLWQWQRPRLLGTWQRYEVIFPEGHPDVKGSHNLNLFYIENKVGDYETPQARRWAMEPSQITYIQWLRDCGQFVYVCFGSKLTKTVKFYRWLDFNGEVFPAFWRGFSSSASAVRKDSGVMGSITK